jgi:hypothetical protein
MRLLIAGGATALALCFAQPALAQDPDEAEDPAAAEAPAASEAPARKAAPRKAAPARTGAPAKPAPPPRTAAPASAPATTPSGKAPITAQDVRPPGNLLIDCAKAPKEAVTKLPDDLARWATVYCTKLGHIFNADDRHFGAFPDNGVRASFSAAEMAGKIGEPGNDAYFTKIDYRELSPAERDALIALDPSVRRVLAGKPLWRLELSAAGGASLSFIVIDPAAEVFWVFPLTQKGIDTPAFYVTSLEALNKVR